MERVEVFQWKKKIQNWMEGKKKLGNIVLIKDFLANKWTRHYVS